MNVKKAQTDASNQPTIGQLKIDGRVVSYCTFGQGKPVLMLHGWGGSKESWLPLMMEMSKESLRAQKSEDGYRFFAVDFPGFGQSDEPEKGWSVADYTNWFEKFVVELAKIGELKDDYILIVHSFGGRVLLKFFADGLVHIKGVKPDKLVLIAAAGIKPSKTFRLLVAGWAARTGKAVMSWPVLRRLAPLAQKILYRVLRTHDYEKTSGVMRDTFIKVIDEDLRDYVNTINRPTLIIWGVQDSYLPVKDAYLMHKQIIGSELQIIKEGRHGIHKTHAKQVAEWILNFLNK